MFQQKHCSHPSCDRPVQALGLCGMHYKRARRSDGIRKPTDVERFWRTIDRSNGDDSCWTWTASTSNGYGDMWADKQPIKAHRFSYQLHYGPIPDGLWVLHRCDNRLCCNPRHLFLGTNQDNVADKVAKGRQHVGQFGEGNARARLTTEQIAALRERYASGAVSQTALAREYGVSQTHVSRIVRHTRWPHLH